MEAFFAIEIPEEDYLQLYERGFKKITTNAIPLEPYTAQWIPYFDHSQDLAALFAQNLLKVEHRDELLEGIDNTKYADELLALMD